MNHKNYTASYLILEYRSVSDPMSVVILVLLEELCIPLHPCNFIANAILIGSTVSWILSVGLFLAKQKQENTLQC